MKNICFSGITVLVLFCLTALSASANSPAYPSSPETDVQVSDSCGFYPEEMQRTELLKGVKVVYFNSNKEEPAPRDSAEALMARFYDDQFRHSQDPEAPEFTFMSKDANLAMGIGATVVLSGWFNWNGYIDGSDFSPYGILIPKTPETNKSLNGSAAGSGLFFSLIGNNRVLGSYRIYIQGGFNGYAHSGFKLKKAWVQVRNFTAGLAPSTFSDPASQPDVLDPAGANGKVSKTNLLVRYMKTFCNRWSIGVSVELPSSKTDVSDPQVSKMKEYIPDFAALGQFQWNRGLSHIRLAGIVRTMAYRDLVSGKTHDVTAWGVLAGTTVKAGRTLTFYGQSSIGQGMASYTGDLSNGNYDLLGVPGESGKLYAPVTFSATVGLKFYWMKSLTSTVALGTLRTLATSGTEDATYKYGQYLAANIIYNFTSRMQIGLEYEAGKRMNFDGSNGNANRLTAMFTASF